MAYFGELRFFAEPLVYSAELAEIVDYRSLYDTSHFAYWYIDVWMCIVDSVFSPCRYLSQSESTKLAQSQPSHGWFLSGDALPSGVPRHGRLPHQAQCQPAQAPGLHAQLARLPAAVPHTRRPSLHQVWLYSATAAHTPTSAPRACSDLEDE